MSTTTRQYRIEGIATTRWYPSDREAWDAYRRASIRRGAPDPGHMPGDVGGDVYDDAGRAAHGVRDGHATVTLRWRVDPAVSTAAALMGRKGGAAKTAAQGEAGRRNGLLGGRPVCLATIAPDTPRRGIGRILWRPVTGEIRVAARGQSWEDAERPEMIGLCSTVAFAVEQIRQAWGVDPAWDLSIVDRR